jgi:hypothetical protein
VILVVAEQRDGVLNRATFEALAAAQQMGGPVKVVVPGAAVASVARELSAAQVDEVISLEHPALAEYTSSGYVQALAGLIAAEAPAHVVLPHTYRTRDFARLPSVQTPCLCGRPFPSVDVIEGRKEDFVVTPDGRILQLFEEPMNEGRGIAVELQAAGASTRPVMV